MEDEADDAGGDSVSGGGGEGLTARFGAGAGAGAGLCLRRGIGSFARPPAAASCWTCALTGTARVTPAIWRTRCASSDAGSLRLTSDGGEQETLCAGSMTGEREAPEEEDEEVMLSLREEVDAKDGMLKSSLEKSIWLLGTISFAMMKELSFGGRVNADWSKMVVN